MKNPSFSSVAGTGERAWPRIIANYRKPDRGRSAFELAVTVIPFAALWALSWIAVHYGFWWGLLLTIPAAVQVEWAKATGRYTDFDVWY